jgi:hypothetical protein
MFCERRDWFIVLQFLLICSLRILLHVGGDDIITRLIKELETELWLMRVRISDRLNVTNIIVKSMAVCLSILVPYDRQQYSISLLVRYLV